jgi:tripartite-type tricarboxylate transporter receptor subunit TctC
MMALTRCADLSAPSKRVPYVGHPLTLPFAPRGRGLLLIFALSLLLAAPSHAQDFYAGRQIRLVIGNNAGTSYDLSARLIARYLGRHIPDTPAIVPENMPGASGLIATNHVYNLAPQDGTVILAALETIPLRQALGDENVKFDAAKMHWLGNPASSVNVIVTWESSPVRTIAEARQISVPIGGTTRDAASGVEVALADNLLGTRFKLVTGYKGTDIDLAMERGEVQGRAGQSWDGWKLTHPDWVRDRRLHVLVQLGVARARDLPDVPLYSEIAASEEARRILDLFAVPVALGRPLLVGPGVPAERVALLRRAFEATMRDPDFRAEAARHNLTLDPVSGEMLQDFVAKILSAPPAIVAKAKAAMSYKD